MLEAYRRDLPLLPGAVEVVRRFAARFSLALASSSNRAIFEEVLRLAGLTDLRSYISQRYPNPGRRARLSARARTHCRRQRDRSPGHIEQDDHDRLPL